jgi:hypothetical protein
MANISLAFIFLSPSLSMPSSPLPHALSFSPAFLRWILQALKGNWGILGRDIILIIKFGILLVI